MSDTELSRHVRVLEGQIDQQAVQMDELDGRLAQMIDLFRAMNGTMHEVAGALQHMDEALRAIATGPLPASVSGLFPRPANGAAPGRPVPKKPKR